MNKSSQICLISLALFGLSGCKTMQNKQSNAKVEFPAFSTEAHRGGRGLMPENTIVAMRHAIDLGVTTLEMDTHITKDGQVVVTHDDYLSPSFMLTPEGREIPKTEAKKYPVYQMDYSLLKQFDLGTKFLPAFPEQKKIKTYIPLLADLITDVQLYSKDKKQPFYNIETKCSAKGDGIVNPGPETFVKLLMDVIQKKGITPYVVIQSFDKRTLQILHKKYPQVRTSFLVDNKKTVKENLEDLGFNPFILSPAFKMVNQDLVKQCHALNIKVIPWTPNTKADIDNLKQLKVDGIISDYPNLLVN
ncbi:glycerophosphodiester phosphodiesterase family protein [Pedobacter heparinus]|uniref:glycerophosphodiester phosphodiesterase family protein n=1 Tax=Pedobacter heparinus TaxID=984 RepID=UPI00292ED94E|nr:glycerophosphodiester phosphodiesterase family protein [Pedobacter heparinus]